MPELVEILGLLVAADEAADETQTFVMTYTGFKERAFVGVLGWPDDVQPPSEHQVDEMCERGWVRLLGVPTGKARTFAIRESGYEAWRAYLARRDHVPGQVDLEWEAMRPVLEELVDRYGQLGAPEVGVDVLEMISDEETGQQNAAAIRELIRAELLEVVFASVAGPRRVRPASDALRMFRGWPAGVGDEALRGLVDALNAEIEHTDDVEKRSALVRVRDGLAGVAREAFLAYMRSRVQGLPSPHV